MSTILRGIAGGATRLDTVVGGSRMAETTVAPPQTSGREQAYAHFKDDAGLPVLQKASVVFWDVLGVAAQSKADRAEAQRGLRTLHAAVEGARARASTEEAGFLRCSSWFTDNVVLATPIIGPQDLEMALGPTFIDVGYMQLMMIREGFLARGGVSFGDVYVDETFVYGPALIDAYQLESGPSERPPCVAVSHEVAAACIAMARAWYPDAWDRPFASELAIDVTTEEVFVDHLGIWLEEEDDARVLELLLPVYRKVIVQQLDTLKQRSRPWQKWRWLADYHDWALRSRGYDEDEYLVGRRSKHRFVGLGEVLLATGKAAADC